MQRSKEKLPTHSFSKLVNLIIENEWLNDDSIALAELWNLCETDFQEQLIIELIERVTFLTSSDLKKLGIEIVNIILNKWSLESKNSFIVAISDDLEADGSQAFLQNLKTRFAGKGNWKEKNFKNNIGAIQEIDNNSNIILLDDFVGSGKTIKRKVEWVKENLKANKKYKSKIYVIAIACMEASRPVLDTLNIEYFMPLYLKKGISDFYAGYALKDVFDGMNDLENKLAQKYNRKNLRDFKFGYSRSEALYALESFSVPNNVFPIFWWPKLKDNSRRSTLFNRL